MVKPDKKLKKILLILGITGVVYGGFKYLLPLVVPFLLAYATALFLRPSVRFLEYRVKLTFRGKERHLPAAFIGAVELTLICGIIALLFYFGGRMLLEQIKLFSARFPDWLSRLDIWITETCRTLERTLGFRNGYLVEAARDMVAEIGAMFRQSTMPLLMNNSMSVLKVLTELVIFLVIYFVAALLSLQEMDEIRERRSRSTFHREFSLMGKRLVNVGSAWLKTQLLIIAITAVLCVLGLTWIGNPYSILLGIAIGVLDALPLFGTGTVLIPWGIFLMLQKQWQAAFVLLGLYVVCYFVRQFVEAKVMGNQVGLSALESLMSMYVGLQLFGIPGFLLGPMGLLLIEDRFELYSETAAVE